MGKVMGKQARVEEDRRRREELLMNLWTQGADLHEIAGTMKVSLAELSELASDRMFRRTLRRLCALGNMRSRLMTSRYRVHAAAKLVALVGEGEGEVARKASVDLLKMGLTARPRKGDARLRKGDRDENGSGKNHGLTEDGHPVLGGEQLPALLEELRKLGEVRDE
ncbi:MAG: hypothetical protein ACYC26_14930 [Phycisphaerales bacterium]